ncbi:MAG: ribosome small subunit-dependent GTPase A [Clostridiales Family XIII bacterium]|jgi:ribosome biogenesis GTPase|nr:ribosome small subunit-dependent GTPase A [Clostridiales Family XIII bacterium]
MLGTITKALSGFYYVKPEQAQLRERPCPKSVYQCRARGLFKKEGVTPLVGDEVVMEPTDDVEVEGVVTGILERRNAFIRPPVANIDLFVCVIAAKDPVPNMEVLDRFLATAEAEDADSLICINKKDLGAQPRIVKIYSSLYPVIELSALSGEGLDVLKVALTGKRAAFAGPSGVGKSSLINRLIDSGLTETGEISAKTGRGRHTTRHVEIIDTDFGAKLYDTPGYTSFEGVNAEEAAVADLFPEFAVLAADCRFDNCRHMNEPDCAIRSAVKSRRIAESRYRSYIRMLEEAQSRNSWE